jgi:hypothetical protein
MPRRQAFGSVSACNTAKLSGSDAMKSGLDHLSEVKRRELARVVEILFSEFEAAITGSRSATRRT